MNINISRFFAEACPRDYSASAAELGPTAGADTWRAAIDDADDWGFLATSEELAHFREWLKPWGAWDDAEIAAFSDVELRALFTQWVAGDIRESGLPDWAEYESRAGNGQCHCSIWRDDSGAVFFELEH